MVYIVITVILLFVILVYFRIADKLNIIDTPNERSSHKIHTLRGAGIVFPIAALISNIIFRQPEVYFLGGVLIISLISFTDDITSLSYKIRFPIHLLGVFLLFYQFQTTFLHLEWYWTAIITIIVIGTMNAYNFMDGINGITGLYSLVFFVSLALYYYFTPLPISEYPLFLNVMIIACVIFLYFNFRKKARCFAGDVGSMSLGFIVCALIIGIIIREEDLKYIFLLAVYGTDSVLTIIHRLILKQNIFLPHRLHYFQILVNERKMSHLLVSAIYAFIQIVINIIIFTTDLGFITTGLIACLPLAVIYVSTKSKLIGDNKSVKNIGAAPFKFGRNKIL